MLSLANSYVIIKLLVETFTCLNLSFIFKQIEQISKRLVNITGCLSLFSLSLSVVKYSPEGGWTE